MLIKKTGTILFLPLLLLNCTRGGDAPNGSTSPSSSSTLAGEQRQEIKNENTSASASEIRHLTAAQFPQKVGQVVNGKPSFTNPKPCLVDFYADWCRPCHAMVPILEELAKEYANQIDFYKVDIDAEVELSNEWKINVLPSFLIVDRQGRTVRLVGMRDKAELVQYLDATLR